MKFIHKPLLIAISAILLVLSFPNFNLWFLAWVGLVPLFFAIKGQRPFKAFLVSYITGVLFFLGTIYWLIHVTLPGMIIAVLYLALYFGIFGLVSSYAICHKSPLTIFAIPAVWVALEWIRSAGIFGFCWALLGHSQSHNLLIIQIADITGAYGVSFVVVMANIAIFLTVRDIRQKKYYSFHMALALILIFLSLGYGVLRTNNIFTGESLRVAVIQGNIPQVEKWDERFRSLIMSKYEALTKLVAANEPDLVVWPETSVPGFLESEPDLLQKVSHLAASLKIPILAGAPSVRGKEENYYNSAILISEDGRIAGRYDKMHLVPFGEYVPFKIIFSFVEKFAPKPIGDFSAGMDHTVFNFFVERTAKEKDVRWRMLKKARFSALICFEDIFPDLTRSFVKRGANFLVNMTNDAWFGNSSAPYQHAQSSVFRAVENRVNVVRAANTGYSCFIDQKGHVTPAVHLSGKNLFVDGFAVEDIILTRTRTFYTLYGDVFAHICIFSALAYIIGLGLVGLERSFSLRLKKYQ